MVTPSAVVASSVDPIEAATSSERESASPPSGTSTSNIRLTLAATMVSETLSTGTLRVAAKLAMSSVCLVVS